MLRSLALVTVLTLATGCALIPPSRPDLAYYPSPRDPGAIKISHTLYRAAQAMAFLDGRSFCVPEDFKPLAVPVFAHRVAIHGMNSSGLKKSVRTEEVIQEIVDSVPVPV